MKCPNCGTEMFSNVGCAKCANIARSADPTQTVAPEYRPRSHRPYSEGRDGALTPEFVPDARVANRYVIHSLVGHGGMGSVYRAHDLELDRTVALKTIRDEMASDEAAIARFKKEIVLSAQVTHKNVCRVFDLGQHEDTRFLTMEFIEGETLGQRIRAGAAFTFEQIAEMMWQTAQALQAAHEAGVVHRDLKPDNIMLDTAGKIAVMDFGIARRVGEIATMGFSGTPRYSAPEQIRGDAQDRRSDLYSFGLIFYEVLTGTHPFPEASSLQAFRDRAALPVARLVDRRADIPAALNEIVLRCLAADPEQRYANAGELANALDSWLNPEAAKPLYARPAFASAMAAALVLSIGGTIWFGRTPPPAPKPVSLLIADFENLTGEPVFTGTMEPALQVALEGASFITTYDRGAARRVAARLRSASTVLDQEAAILVAVREGIGAVAHGAIRSNGGRYTLTIRTMDPASGKNLLKDQSLSVGRDQVLAAVGRLSIPIRTVLGDTTPENEQITAAETFTASSMEAAHAYAKAQDLQLAGRYDEAAKAYEEAIRLDAFAQAQDGMHVPAAPQAYRACSEKDWPNAAQYSFPCLGGAKKGHHHPLVGFDGEQPSHQDDVHKNHRQQRDDQPGLRGSGDTDDARHRRGEHG